MTQPYYERGGIQIWHGDCREILPRLEVDVDMVIADPPYEQTSLTWDRRVDGWPDLAFDLVKLSGSLWVFGSLRSFMRDSHRFSRWKFAQDIVWEKHNGSSFHADRFRRVHEQIAQFYQGLWEDVYCSPVMTNDATRRTVRRKQRPPHMGHIEAGAYASNDGGPRLMRSVIKARSCHGTAIHPTEKPIAVVTPLIEYSCPPGGLVLDPFAGSGSTLDAARRLGRSATGIELHEPYAEAAARRLEQEVMAL